MRHLHRRFQVMPLVCVCALWLCGFSLPPIPWSKGADLPYPRTEVQVAVLGNRLFVLGGYPKDRESRVDVFDVATGRWSPTEPMPVGGNHLAVAAGDGHIYVFGGVRNGDLSDDAFAFDGSTDHWSRLPPFPGRCSAAAAVFLEGKIHIVGGDCMVSPTLDEDVSRHWVFDPASRQYSEAAAIPWPREHFSLIPVDGRLYAIGGRQGDKTHETADVEVYDPPVDRWSPAAPLPEKRSGYAAEYINGSVVVIGGDNGREGRQEPSHADVFVYDVRANSWSRSGALPYGVHGTGAAALGGRLYLPAGSKMGGHDFPLRSMLISSPISARTRGPATGTPRR